MSRPAGRSRPAQALALEYDGRGAPRVSARGGGAVAARILELARAHGVPVCEDPALLDLLAGIDLGAEIPPELYLAVAEVLAFAYRLAARDPPARPDERAQDP